MFSRKGIEFLFSSCSALRHRLLYMCIISFVSAVALCQSLNTEEFNYQEFFRTVGSDSFSRWIELNRRDTNYHVVDYVQWALDDSMTNSESAERARLLEVLALIYEDVELNFDSSYHYFQKSIKLYKQLGLDEQAQEINLLVSGILVRNQKNNRALNHVFEAISYYEKHEDQYNLALAYTKLIAIYTNNVNAEKGIEYGNKAIELLEKFETNPRGERLLARSYYNLAKVYNQNKQTKKALRCVSKSIALANKYPNNESTQEWLIMSLNVRGLIYRNQEKYELAAEDFRSYLAIELKRNNRDGQDVAKTNLAGVLLKQGKAEEAIKFLEESMQYSEKHDDLIGKLSVYQRLAPAYAQIKNYQDAFAIEEKFSTNLMDYYGNQIANLKAELEIKYDSEKKEQKIDAQADEINKQALIRNLSLGLTTLLFLLLGSLFYNFRKNKKNSALLRKKSDQNELLLKEIHHRVKNNLEVVSSLLGLQSANLDDEQAKEAMKTSQNRVLSMGIIHQKLYQRDNLAAVEMKDYFINLSEGVLDNFGKEQQVKIECIMDDLELDIDTAVPIGLIVNELLTNAMKYAFPENRSGTIQLTLKNVSEERLELVVKDDGIGHDFAQEGSKKGFGSQLVSLLTDQLNGAMKLIVENGTAYTFTFNKI